MAANLTANFTANTANFSAGVQEIKKQLTALNTALEANKQKIAEANKEIKESQKRLEELKKATSNGATATAEQAQEMQQLQDSIARTTADLGSLKTTQQELTAQQRNYNRSLQDMQQQADKTVKISETLGKNFKDLGKEIAVVYGAISAAVGALYKFTADAADMADEINTLSTVTGLSTDTIQKYSYAADLCDISLDTLADSIKQIKLAMTSGTKSTLFDSLNVKITDTAGALRDSESVFYDVIAALHQMPNATERDAMAMELLGESASKLNTIIADGGENFRKVSAEMEKYILPQSTLDRLNDFNDKIDKIKARWKGVSAQMGAEFADSFDGAFDFVNSLFDGLEGKLANGDFAKFADELADDLVAVGNAVGNVIKFIWDFRDVIGSAVVSLATFRAAIAIGNIIDTTVTSIKSFTAATKSADAAQKALNATGAANPYVLIASAITAVIGGLISYASAADTAADTTRKLNQEVENLNQKAAKSADVARDVQALADEYASLYQQTANSADAKERLKAIQDQLVGTYGTESDKLDLVNGKYAEQLGILQGISAEKAAQAERDAKEAYLAAQETKGKSYAFSVYGLDTKSQQFSDWYKSLEQQDVGVFRPFAMPGYGGGNDVHFPAGTDYDAMLSALTASLDSVSSKYGNNVDAKLYAAINGAIKDVQAAKTEYDTAVNNYNNINAPSTGKKQTVYDDLFGRNHPRGNSGSSTTTTKTPNEGKYDSGVADLDYKLSMDLITEKEYYAQLAVLRDTYLSENSEKWKKANIAIHKYNKSLNDSDNTLGSYAERESNRVTSALDKVEKAYKDTLDAIDREIEKHDRAKQDEEMQQKIDVVTAKLRYEKIDDLTKREYEKELARLQEERAEIQYDRQMADAKTAAKYLYNNADSGTLSMYTATLSPPSYTDVTAALNNATAAINRLNDSNTGAVSNISNTTTNNNSTNNKNNINITGIDRAIDNLAYEIKKAISSQL